jgi:hypothetical protein
MSDPPLPQQSPLDQLDPVAIHHRLGALLREERLLRRLLRLALTARDERRLPRPAAGEAGLKPAKPAARPTEGEALAAPGGVVP